MSHPVPELRARRVIASNRFVRYVEEDLGLPDGSGYTYYLLEGAGEAVMVLPILASGELLLERIYRHALGAWCVEPPAGGIEPGEDVIASAQRELLEETGYGGGTWRSLGWLSPLAGMVRLRAHVVVAQGVHPVAKPQRETLEWIEPFTCSVAEAEAQAHADGASGILALTLSRWRHHCGC